MHSGQNNWKQFGERQNYTFSSSVETTVPIFPNATNYVPDFAQYYPSQGELWKTQNYSRLPKLPSISFFNHNATNNANCNVSQPCNLPSKNSTFYRSMRESMPPLMEAPYIDASSNFSNANTHYHTNIDDHNVFFDYNDESSNYPYSHNQTFGQHQTYSNKFPQGETCGMNDTSNDVQQFHACDYTQYQNQHYNMTSGSNIGVKQNANVTANTNFCADEKLSSTNNCLQQKSHQTQK